MPNAAAMAAIDLTEVSLPSCCQFAPGQPASQTLAREAQSSVAPSSLQTSVSAFSAVLPSGPSRDIRPMPHRSTSSRLQSVLCTFLI
jgi:hypothetical protein